LSARYVDPQKSVGDLMPGQHLFTSGVSDAVVEVGLPFTRVYDPVEELARLRGIWARQAARRLPPAGANTFHHRSLRRI
jgi:hypothetical protein